MRKGIRHLTGENIAPRQRTAWMRLAALAAVCLTAATAFTQEAQEPAPAELTPLAAESRQEPPKLSPEAQLQELTAATRRNVMARTLKELQQQARQTEEMLSRPEAQPQELRQVLRAELQALDELILLVQSRLRDPEPAAQQVAPVAEGALPQAREEPARPDGDVRRPARPREVQRTRVRQDLSAAQSQIHALQDQIHALREELERRETERRAMDQQRGEVLRGQEETRTELRRQQEEVRAQIGRMEEQLHTIGQRAGAETQGYRLEIERLRTDLQRMGQTLGQIEHERLGAQGEMKTEVRELQRRAQELRDELLRIQGTLNMLLARCERSTVGSAGYVWGW